MSVLRNFENQVVRERAKAGRRLGQFKFGERSVIALILRMIQSRPISMSKRLSISFGLSCFNSWTWFRAHASERRVAARISFLKSMTAVRNQDETGIASSVGNALFSAVSLRKSVAALPNCFSKQA